MNFSYQKILQAVLIDNTWPSLVMDDYTLRMQIVAGAYFSEEQFLFAKRLGQLPFTTPMLIKIESAYKHDWKKELTGEGKPAKVVDIGKKAGRNDPCPCQSGKKNKDCCKLY